jgi:hypothetical protein
MKFLFLAALLASLSPAAVAPVPATLGPLKESVSALRAAKPDFSEAAYVGARLAALLTAMQEHLEEDLPEDPEYKAGMLLITKEIGERALLYFRVAAYLDLSFNQRSDAYIQEQRAHLVKSYGQEMVRGKQLNNSVMTPLVGEDMRFSRELYPLYEKIWLSIEQLGARPPTGI